MKKERVIAAVSHMQTEFTPYNIELTSVLTDKLCDYLKISKSGLWAWFGNHIEKVGYNKGSNINGLYVDEFGVKWDRSGRDKDIGIITDYCLKEPEVKDYNFPLPILKM